MNTPTFTPPAALLPVFLLDSALVDTDEVLLVGIITEEDDSLTIVGSSLSSEQKELISESLLAVGAKGKILELTRIPAPDNLAVSSVLAVGLGSGEESSSPERIRRAAGVAARNLSNSHALVTTLSELDLAATVEGFALGSYSFPGYKTSSSPAESTQLRLLVEHPESDSAQTKLSHARSLAESVFLARDLTNTPPNFLYPESFASFVATTAADLGISVTILDDQQLEHAGYGGLIGVGKGSSRPPRLVTLEYRGRAEESAEIDIALVGKGVTFDTGGISIKPAGGMENMTSDMGGAAAVTGAIVAAAKLGVKLNILASLALAENMPSAHAQRPGDIITHYGGKTTLVINTDAEGRLILADAIVAVSEREPRYLIDVATLTGAQLVALGTRTPGVMGTKEFRDRVAQISQSVGEEGWPMPLPEELAEDIKPPLADLANSTNHRNGGMLSAALFLKNFIPDGIEWAHLDVAGPAYNTGGPYGYVSKGGTGIPVRTLVAVFEEIVERG